MEGTKREFDDSKISTHRQNIPWSEIQLHDKTTDSWLVLDGKAYNVTNWADRHPGGRRILSLYVGKDATEAFTAFHKDIEFARKFLSPLCVGEVEGYTVNAMVRDFATLRETADRMGLFTPSFRFYALMLSHVILLEILAYLVVLYFGAWWLPFCVSALLQSIYVMQGTWLQHDYGHGSACNSRLWRQVFQYITGSLIMGFSPRWWNNVHFRHHAKPNVISKDPDLYMGPFYVLGETMAREAAKYWKSPLPFHKQHIYYFAVSPPLTMSVFMQITGFVFMIINKCWLDLLLWSFCFLRYFYLYEPLLGLRWTLVMFVCIRCIHSVWFMNVGLSNHIPMQIGHNDSRPWLQHQVESTCNIEPSTFNDWFTGHLNFHVEHHLFPTMPRHNLCKVAPYVKSLCKKHDLPYVAKPMGQAFRDITRSLKFSGNVWLEARKQFNSFRT